LRALLIGSIHGDLQPVHAGYLKMHFFHVGSADGFLNLESSVAKADIPWRCKGAFQFRAFVLFDEERPARSTAVKNSAFHGNVPPKESRILIKKQLPTNSNSNQRRQF
jgi:hypothetical protein